MEYAFAIYGFNLVAALALFFCVWLLSLPLKNASIVDVFWGLGFVLLAWLTYFRTDGYVGRKLLLAILVTIWGLRLSVHIGWRNRGKGEDRRYQAWRAEHGRRFWWVSLFTVFGVQALLMWVISLCFQTGQISKVPARLTWLDGVGLLIWVVGFLFEVIGDRQLSRFKADSANKGKVMDRGLWAYTRHPNYFGEMLMWWGIFLIVMSASDHWWTIISPATISFLLLKVSGVTLLEKTIAETRPDYATYKRQTSAFFPWFPKKRT
jgi:steroid 5-alpha reductase family enzyme